MGVGFLETEITGLIERFGRQQEIRFELMDADSGTVVVLVQSGAWNLEDAELRELAQAISQVEGVDSVALDITPS